MGDTLHGTRWPGCGKLFWILYFNSFIKKNAENTIPKDHKVVGSNGLKVLCRFFLIQNRYWLASSVG